MEHENILEFDSLIDSTSADKLKILRREIKAKDKHIKREKRS